MSETTPRPYKRRKHSAEAVAIASAIAEAVAEVQEQSAPEPIVEEPVTAYRAPVAVAVVATLAAHQKMVKVKATESVRGVYGNFRYAIEVGQVYTLPESVAAWLVSVGRAV